MVEDRRQHQRLVPSSSILVCSGESKSGFLVDLCEGGLAVDGLALESRDEVIPVVFELPEGNGYVQAGAEIAWTNDSGHRTGLRFVDLADTSRQQVRDWVSARAYRLSAPGSNPSASRRHEMAAALKRLLEELPRLHCPEDCDVSDKPTEEAELVNWGIQGSFLELLAGLLTSESLTLETGCGLSTVCFAIIGSEHICLSPFPREHDRIREYCRKHQISTERIRFLPMKSHVVLPSLDIGGRKLDFALIDGAHAFPEPILDYYYVNKHLKVGGLLAIDDLNITGIGILHKFLMTEPAYELVKVDGLKTGIYRKVGETHYPLDQCSQRFNRRYPDFSYLPFQTRVRKGLRPVEERLRMGLAGVPGIRDTYHLLRAPLKSSRELIALFVVAVLLSSASVLLAHYVGRIWDHRQAGQMTATPKAPEFPSKVSIASAYPSPMTSPSLPATISLDLPGFVLQVGAMAHEESADELVAALQQRNFPAFVFKRGADRFYRVAVGPYSDADSTVAVKNRLEKQGFETLLRHWAPE
jgi:SPOR domain/Methyltransferase domain/PilZ domain